jgi:hypothetical protein
VGSCFVFDDDGISDAGIFQVSAKPQTSGKIKEQNMKKFRKQGQQVERNARWVQWFCNI